MTTKLSDSLSNAAQSADALTTLRKDGSETKEGADAASRLFSIGDMAKTYKVTLRALRFYEDRGLIKPIRQGVARFYDSSTRARFEIILKGKQLGFTLGQISEMLPNDQHQGDAPGLDLKEAQILVQIDQLQRKRDDIDFAIAELRRTHSIMADDRSANFAGERANLNRAAEASAA